MSISFFLGANSHAGFASLYDELFPSGETPARVFLIKGGPGTGKSTIMRRAAQKLELYGKSVERIFCSSDTASLDGIRVIGEGKAILDATSPHVREPLLPGAVEDYVSLCSSWNHFALAADKAEIARLFNAYKSKFNEAYKSLAAAKAVDDVLFDLALSRADSLYLRARGLALAKKISPDSGAPVKRFLSSISGRGFLTQWNSVASLADQIIAIDDAYVILSPTPVYFIFISLSNYHAKIIILHNH